MGLQEGGRFHGFLSYKLRTSGTGIAHLSTGCQISMLCFIMQEIRSK